MTAKHNIVVEIKNNNFNEAYNNVNQNVKNAVEGVKACDPKEHGMFSLLCHLYFKYIQIHFFKMKKAFFLFQIVQILL